MNITHVMKNGEVRKSIDGVSIQSKEFYAVLQGILENRGAK